MSTCRKKEYQMIRLFVILFVVICRGHCILVEANDLYQEAYMDVMWEDHHRTLKGLVYNPTFLSLMVGVTIEPAVPSLDQGIPTRYTIDPILPPGLALNTETGIIYGKPSGPSSSRLYNVTAISEPNPKCRIFMYCDSNCSTSLTIHVADPSYYYYYYTACSIVVSIIVIVTSTIISHNRIKSYVRKVTNEDPFSYLTTPPR